MKKSELFKQEISKYLEDADSSQIHLYWKGRVALYAILKATGIGIGDEVIVPAYTCVVVPNAILYAGATPVYVEIDPLTFNADKKSIENAITENTKAILCQNTFGLSSQVDEIAALAKNRGILSIEDCTHGFGGKFKNKFNGTYCDAAFFSTQWNKPFSTGVGGFSYISNPALNEKVVETDKKLCAPSLISRMSLAIQLFIRKTILTDRTYWTLVPLYRMLSKRNIVLGSSSGSEISSVQMPDKYFMAMSGVQVKSGIINIRKLPALTALRKANAEKYSDYLRRFELNSPADSLFDNHSFLKYPLLVKDRRKVMALAEKQKVSLGDWLNSPLHPVQDNFGLWKMNVADFPVASFSGKHMINLPLESDAGKTLMFLDMIKPEIFSVSELKQIFHNG